MDTTQACVETFNRIYKGEPQDVAFCPYRICPVGAHTDFNLGKVTGFAIDKGIHIAFRPKYNGVIEMMSLQFEKRAQWHISFTPESKCNDWADYLRGATIALAEEHPLSVGLCGVIEGSLPIGGLSSSAAVTIAFISALCKVNNIVLSPEEMIKTALTAERKYVGISCGKLDQSCEVYCKKGSMLYLDTLDDSFEVISPSSNIKPYKFAVFFGGIERALTGSKINMRVDESISAAYALKAFSGMEYGKFNETYLRDVPFEIYQQYKDKLPVNWRKRAEHWYTECQRVEASVEAWRKGDIEEYGRLSFESGKSSIVNWETGSPQLSKIYDIMTKTDGIYGGRFSGAGFNGCCIALIDPEYTEQIIEKVSTEYLKAFPELEGKYSAYICESADGIEQINSKKG